MGCMAKVNRMCIYALRGAARAIGLLVIASACTAPAGSQRETRQESVKELPILWETSGTWSHLTRPARIVIYDAATLAEVPVAQVPVDFSKQMVLLTALGPTIGQDMGVRIERVWQEGPEVHVLERRLHPGLEQSAVSNRSSPWTIVVVPRSEVPVKGYSSRVPSGLLGS
jgi:hypothetical protein